MLPRIPRRSSLVWCAQPIVGYKRANLLKVALVAAAAVIAACLLALVWTVRPAGATFPGQNGKIAYERWDGTDAEIYIINPDGTGETQLTNNTLFDGVPKWSPDGTKIAYSRWDGTDTDMYTINPDGTGETNLTNSTTLDIYHAWSPDDTMIAYVRWDTTEPYATGQDIYTIPATGGTPSVLTQGTNPDWQPLPEPLVPTCKADCKHGGYKKFGFKNQGQYVAFVQRGPKTGQ